MKKQICASFAVAGAAMSLASCGDSASQTPVQSLNSGATGSTATPGVRVNLDAVGPCELFTQADADKIAGKPLITHLIQAVPIQNLGKANVCAYSDTPNASAQGVPGTPFLAGGLATIPGGTASAANVLAKGGSDLTSTFGLPAAYSPQRKGDVVVLDPTHVLVSVAYHVDPSGRIAVADEAKAIAVMRAELRNIR